MFLGGTGRTQPLDVVSWIQDTDVIFWGFGELGGRYSGSGCHGPRLETWG